MTGAAELERLESHETIRILDLLFVGKDAETGDLLALDYQGEDLGAIVGALLGVSWSAARSPAGSRPPRSAPGRPGQLLRTMMRPSIPV